MGREHNQPPSSSPWLEGASDAIGFLAGALSGYGIGHLLGLDLFAEGYDTRSIFAIALVGLGGGVGVSAARRWRLSRSGTRQQD